MRYLFCSLGPLLLGPVALAITLVIWLPPLGALLAGVIITILLAMAYRAGKKAGPVDIPIPISDVKDGLATKELMIAAVNHLPIGVSVSDRNGHNVFISQHSRSLLGYPPEQFLGKHETEVAQMMGMTDTLIRRILGGREVASRVLTHDRISGRITNVLTDGKAIRNTKGELLGVLITYADASETIELETARSLLSYLFEQVDEGILVIDSSKQIVYVNRKAVAFAHKERHELVGHLMEEVLPGNTQQRLYRCVDEGYVEGERVDPSWHLNGQPRTVKTSMKPLVDGHGVCLGAVVFFDDMTEDLAIKANAQRAERLALIGQMAAGMAHEIRNPLTTVRGFTQFLAQKLDAQGMSEDIEFTQLMISEVDRVNALITDFLHLAKPKQTVPAPIDLDEWLDSVTQLCQSEALRRQINFSMVNKAAHSVLVGERDRLTQLLLNLVDNAYKACSAGGAVNIEVSQDVQTQNVQIRVRDNGYGIPAKDLDHLFDPFFTTREDGTGLGLSICQRIVSDHGGTLVVEESSPRGTTFLTTLPLGR